MEGENTKGKKGEAKKGREKQTEKSTGKCNSSITDGGRFGIADFQTSQQTLTIRIYSTENKSSFATD